MFDVLSSESVHFRFKKLVDIGIARYEKLQELSFLSRNVLQQK